MGQYGDQVASIPGRLFRWALKMAVGYAVLIGVSGYALHRALPQRTQAAWDAFWAEGRSCEVPPGAQAEEAAPGAIVMKGKPSAKKAAAPPPPPAAEAAPAPAAASPVRPEIVVFGRDACGLTARMRQALTKEGVPFRYASVDDAAGGGEVSRRLRAIGHQGGYGLPVVAMGDKTEIRPSVEDVVRAYRGE